MELNDYLKATDQTYETFGKRAGVATNTIARAARKTSVPNGKTCLRIIQASKDRPAPDGGTVTMEDLCRVPHPAESAA